MKLTTKQIKALTIQLLEQEPGGIRWSDLLRSIQDESPDTPFNTIRGATHSLFQDSQQVVRVARGTYQLEKYATAEAVEAKAEEEAAASTPVKTEGAQSVTEQDFYDSFAEWLEENDEATFASALGGSSFGGKWGTPDVIGVLKPRAQDIFKFEPQIVAAEIKAVPGQPVVAFGQAVAYRLFCHKSYIVVPNTTSSDDMNRLKALCGLHGVGLVTFTLDVAQPDYIVVVLPAVAAPDMFYVNTMLERLKASEPGLLNKLF